MKNPFGSNRYTSNKFNLYEQIFGVHPDSRKYAHAGNSGKRSEFEYKERGNIRLRNQKSFIRKLKRGTV
jgi:hypothetical protein